MAPALSSFRSGSQLDEPGGELGGLGVAEWGERAPQMEVDGGPGGGVEAVAAAPFGGDRLDEDLARLVQVAANSSPRPRRSRAPGCSTARQATRSGAGWSARQCAEQAARSDDSSGKWL